ncbi:MAG: hypothetical protein AAGM67_20815, partial [Bacteroidota bacterium]
MSIFFGEGANAQSVFNLVKLMHHANVTFELIYQLDRDTLESVSVVVIPHMMRPLAPQENQALRLRFVFGSTVIFIGSPYAASTLSYSFSWLLSGISGSNTISSTPSLATGSMSSPFVPLQSDSSISDSSARSSLYPLVNMTADDIEIVLNTSMGSDRLALLVNKATSRTSKIRYL